MYSSDNITRTHSFIRLLTDRLRQMSYYYGIVFTWSYAISVASVVDQDQEIRDYIVSVEDIPQLYGEKPEDDSGTVGWHSIGTDEDGTYNIDYVCLPNKVYNIPSTMHVDSVTNKMVKVTYQNCTLSNAKIMTPEDKYNWNSVITKIHYSNGKYLQFKFKGETLTLPSASDLVNAPTNAKWRLVGKGTDYNLGASYPIESKDDVTFYLVS